MKKLCLLIPFFMLFTPIVESQNEYRLYNHSTPRIGLNGDKKGYYDFIARINNAVLNQGEFLTVEIYFTGYGDIRNSKFNFYPSLDIINPLESTMTFGLIYDSIARDKSRISWGKQKVYLTEAGLSLDIGTGGRVYPNWNDRHPTLFFDVDTGATPPIITETSQFGTAPIVFKLRIKDHAAPGTHFLHFGFTYFNGDEWSGSNQQIQFTIKNVFQKHENLISVVALIATLITIFASILTICDFFAKRKLKKSQVDVSEPTQPTVKQRKK